MRAWLSEVAIRCCAVALSYATLGHAADLGMRFDTPGVLDLSDRSLTIANGMPVPARELTADDADAIFAAPVQHEMSALVFSDDVYGCAKPARSCSAAHERELVSAEHGAVTREGKRLVVAPESGAPLVFVDWQRAATKTADGDAEEHWYLGRLAGSGYQRIEVDFGQDSPGNFLVEPHGGKAVFVHNGEDIAAPSSDGRLLVTFNVLNAPLSLRVAELGVSGPALVLQCEAVENDLPLTPVFKGWRGPNVFDLVIEAGKPGTPKARFALRFSREQAGWTFATDDLVRLAETGLICHASQSET